MTLVWRPIKVQDSASVPFQGFPVLEVRHRGDFLLLLAEIAHCKKAAFNSNANPQQGTSLSLSMFLLLSSLKVSFSSDISRSKSLMPAVGAEVFTPPPCSVPFIDVDMDDKPSSFQDFPDAEDFLFGSKFKGACLCGDTCVLIGL